MAVAKKKAKATSSVSVGSGTSKKVSTKFSFNKWALIAIFIVVFGGLGSYALYVSHAATSGLQNCAVTVVSGVSYTSVRCASVTAINKGSHLLLHKQPNYTGGSYTGSFTQAVNGQIVYLSCWTTGSGDADGHGDHYWFKSSFGGPGYTYGYVNDWYVTTGSYSYWSKYIPHC